MQSLAYCTEVRSTKYCAYSQASSSVSRTIICKRVPNVSLRPSFSASAPTRLNFSPNAGGLSAKLRYTSSNLAACSTPGAEVPAPHNGMLATAIARIHFAKRIPVFIAKQVTFIMLDMKPQRWQHTVVAVNHVINQPTTGEAVYGLRNLRQLGGRNQPRMHGCDKLHAFGRGQHGGG
ncbi:conserved hypothetical protein [Ricinus communis]|uniref:Uncharacterized protein n=1 Tax=Ricinus communis TaxID=3988 RepID=B9T8J7_RICCO|nr:conserved hypothetical protein [Ricinus communis]